jgi:hypothetical protein
VGDAALRRGLPCTAGPSAVSRPRRRAQRSASEKNAGLRAAPRPPGQRAQRAFFRPALSSNEGRGRKMLSQKQKNQGRIEHCDADLEKMPSVQRVAQAAVIELMANRSLRRLATLRSVTARPEVMRMMSSRCAAPHQGSGCVTPPTNEAEDMAATEPPITSNNRQPLPRGWVHI